MSHETGDFLLPFSLFLLLASSILLLPSSSPSFSSPPLLSFFLPSRTQLQKFFFPNDYMEHPVSERPQPGEKRIYTNFDVSVQVSSSAIFNVFFRDKEVCECMGGREEGRVGEGTGREEGWRGERWEGGREGRSVSQSVVHSVSRDDEDRRRERESD